MKEIIIWWESIDFRALPLTALTLGVSEHFGNRSPELWDSESALPVTHLPSPHRTEEASGNRKTVQEKGRRSDAGATLEEREENAGLAGWREVLRAGKGEGFPDIDSQHSIWHQAPSGEMAIYLVVGLAARCSCCQAFCFQKKGLPRNVRGRGKGGDNKGFYSQHPQSISGPITALSLCLLSLFITLFCLFVCF